MIVQKFSREHQIGLTPSQSVDAFEEDLMGRPRREKDNQSPEESAAEPLILRSNPCAFTVVTAPPTLSGEGMRGRETQRHGSRDSRAAVRRLRSEKEGEEKMTNVRTCYIGF